MYCTNFMLYGMKSYPLLLSSIYGGVADIYGLPGLDLLMNSLKIDVVWPPVDRLQVHYLDSLTEYVNKDLFQVRFSSSKDSRDLVSIFLSVENSVIQNITFVFPGRTGRGTFSQVLGIVKTACNALRLGPNDFGFEVQGFPEQGNARYIREHSLSAFVWIEALGRYVHVLENPSDFQDVRKGRRSL